jgi:hypothetical protein
MGAAALAALALRHSSSRLASILDFVSALTVSWSDVAGTSCCDGHQEPRRPQRCCLKASREGLREGPRFVAQTRAPLCGEVGEALDAHNDAHAPLTRTDVTDVHPRSIRNLGKLHPT